MLRELRDRLHPLPVYTTDSVEANRALMAATAEVASPVEPLPVELGIVGSAEHPVPWRVHRPSSADHPQGAIVHIHGGGFVMGTAELYDTVCAELAERTGMIVISIDYRLAPEHPYPAALDDCTRAWDAAVEQSAGWGVDPAMVGIYGESAGAALAVGVIARQRAAGHPTPAFLVLQEPSLDDRLTTPSSRAFVDAHVWNRPLSEWTWQLYLGNDSSSTSPPPEAAPARLDDLAGFPPTFVSTRDLDALRDEGIGFAVRLIAAGVPTELRHYPGTFHGCASILGTEVGERIVADACDFMTRAVTAPWA